MAPDPAAAAGLVAREVRTSARDGAATRIVVARRLYPAPQADLWDALTNPERIPRWFLPVTGDLRVGGRYQFAGNSGGIITECVPNKKIGATWEFGGGGTWVTVTLTP